MFETPSRRLFSTPDASAPGDFVCRRLRVPKNSQWLSLVNGALSLLIREKNYEVNADGISVEETVEVFREMFYEYGESEEFCMIGTIVASAIRIEEIPEHLLLCDGSTHSRSAYPDLYNRLSDEFRVDDDNFIVPDLLGRVIVGSGAFGIAYASQGGEKEVTLIVDNLASHSHDNLPHSHSEITAIASVTTPGELPVPVSSAIPGIGVTGSSTIVISSTGSDVPHNNMQPYTALKYFIIAK